MQRVLFFLLIFLGYDCDVFFWLETMLWRAKSSVFVLMFCCLWPRRFLWEYENRLGIKAHWIHSRISGFCVVLPYRGLLSLINDSNTGLPTPLQYTLKGWCLMSEMLGYA